MSAKQPASTAWEYESNAYAAGSSLPSLSLLVPDTPTQPQITSSSSGRETRRLPGIDEIDTTPPPPPSSAQTRSTHRQPISLRPDEAGIAELSPVLSHLQPEPSIDEIDTLPDLYSGVGREVVLSRAGARSSPVTSTIYDAPAAPPSALVFPAATTRVMVSSAHQTGMVEGDTASWTAGKAANSSYAQLIANHAQRKRKRQTLALNPVDRVRWWLLHPGRIEFMLWLFGTILLITVTCSFLLLTAFSLNWLTPPLPGGTTSSIIMNAATGSGTHTSPALTTTPGLVLTLLDKGPLLPGQPIHLHGQGFTHQGYIAFTYDGMHPCLDQHGQDLIIQADTHGTFTVTIWPGDGPTWNTGHHIIIARDRKTNHLAALDIELSAGPYGKTVPSAPAHATAPGATPTSVSSGTGGGTVPTPVGQTPVPVTPTVTSTPSPAPSPSPTQVPPSPTATPTSTAGTTPTPTPTPTGTPGGNLTPSVGSNNSGPSSLGNALSSDSVASPSSFHQPGFNPLVLLMIACYTLAIALLGVASILHKRRK